MNGPDCRAALTRIMLRHGQCIDRATAYLDEIKQAFIENRLQGLQELLVSPRFDLGEIEALETERHQLLADLGFDRNESGFKACVEWCDDSDRQLHTLYLELIEKLKALQCAIQVNSLLFNKGRDRVRRSIGVLTGLASGGGETYGRQGQTVDTARRRNLAIV